MKRNILLYMLSMLPLVGGCLMEYPEVTEDGEIGVDPTSVTVNLKIDIDLSLGDEVADYSDDEYTYMHRIKIAAYDAGTRQLERTETIYEDLTGTNRLQTSASLTLHAKEYRIVVWSDIVREGDGGIYYNIDDLVSIRYTDNYRGQTIYKDAFYASQDLDLSGYGDEWGSRVAVDMELQRPMGVYELVATDVDRFLSRIGSGDISGTTFTARINYDSNLPTGFNAYDGITKHAFRYMTFRRTFSAPSEGTEDFSLVFDYVLLDGEEDDVALTLDILDEKNDVIASTSLNVHCTRNERTVIRRPFLTSQPGDGIGIDTDFDEKDDIDIGII